MENDNQRIETFQHFDNIKQRYKEITSNNNKNKEEIIMNLLDKKSNPEASQVLLSSENGVTITISPKMGSRRIFTPQFKLQVLESYRNDHDCKGNQRATARKYNIHRRQIQKWLQCEPSLRSSVANINQNSVKHQFHNVSMQQQQQTNKNVIIATQPSVSNLSYTTSSQQHSAHLCLDSTKISTSHKTINVPSLSSCRSTLTSAQETQAILDSNLNAVVVAAGSIARTNTSSTSSVTSAVVSPLRPSAIIGANRNTSSSMPPLLHHHHHHYGIPSYTNMSSTTNVPILVHHLTNSQQASYQYHNITYSPSTLPHHQTEKQHSASYFTPISLPTVNVLSATASASNSYTGGDTEHIDEMNLFPIMTKKYPKISSDKNFMYNDDQFHDNYECPVAPGIINTSSTLKSLTSINHFNGDSPYSAMYSFAPMDLSLRHSRETKSETVSNTKCNFQASEIPTKKKHNDNTLDVVDLTYRKRRVFSTSYSSNDYKNQLPEKQQKLFNPDAVQNTLDTYNTSEVGCNMETNPSNSVEDDDIEIEVGVEEKFPPASKPVKLFKPYLLDESENNNYNFISCNKNKLSKNEKSEEKEHNAKKDDSTINENNFQDVKENINNCADSSNFLLESRSDSPRSACSTATSPTNFQYPKGSPASSGYESSTSSYSDTCLSSKNDTCAYGKTYSVNLQMQAIYNENIHAIHPSKHVERWLEKDDSNSMETSSTIALLV